MRPNLNSRFTTEADILRLLWEGKLSTLFDCV